MRLWLALVDGARGWSLGKGKYQRRDFRFDTLTHMAAFSEEGTLFAHLGRHEIFTPIKTNPPMTMAELAAAPLTQRNPCVFQPPDTGDGG